MPEKKDLRNQKKPLPNKRWKKIKVEIYGEEMVEKTVKLSGSSGRLYLPAVWVGSRVKIVKLN